MRYWGLLVVAAAVAAFPLIAPWFLPSDAAVASFYRAEVIGVKALAGLGCLVALLEFRRGDYLWTAWLFAAMNSWLLVVTDLVAGTSTNVAEGLAASFTAQDAVRATLLVAANAAMPAAVWLFACAVNAAGLGELVPPRARVLGMLLGALVACALAGKALYTDASAVASGSFRHIGDVAGGLGDIVPMILLVPLLMTMLLFRGGSLVWPYALLVASTGAWLFFDATVLIGELTRADPAHLRRIEEAFRALGCTLLGAAGVAQRFVIRTRDSR